MIIIIIIAVLFAFSTAVLVFHQFSSTVLCSIFRLAGVYLWNITSEIRERGRVPAETRSCILPLRCLLNLTFRQLVFINWSSSRVVRPAGTTRWSVEVCSVPRRHPRSCVGLHMRLTGTQLNVFANKFVNSWSIDSHSLVAWLVRHKRYRNMEQ